MISKGALFYAILDSGQISYGHIAEYHVPAFEIASMKASAVQKPTVAVIHPSLWWGGSEPCALWAVEALKDQFEVTLITSSEVDLDQLNRYYGTHLQAHELRVIRIPVPVPFKWVKGFFMLRYFRLARYCRKNSSRFQVMFSSYNPMDFGKRGIQYILDPHFNQELLSQMAGRPGGIRGFFYMDSPWRRFYQFIYKTLSGVTVGGFNKNLTLVDSDWTGRLTQQFMCIETTTVYPPVVAGFKPKPWEDKEQGFICIGRINPEKEIEKIIDILSRLRARGFELHLHIVGTIGSAAYFQYLKKLSSLKDWVFFEIGVPFSRKKELLETHRYGIHGRQNEPFGIAVAEMVKAGCLVWVPQGGGQVEIVDQTELTYMSSDDAVAKISSVLASPASQGRLRRHLSQRARLFSTAVYMQNIKKTVDTFLSSFRSGGSPGCDHDPKPAL